MNFLKRTLTGSIYVAVVAGSILYHPLAYSMVSLILLILGSREISRFSGSWASPPSIKTWITSLSGLAFSVVALVFFRYIPPVSLAFIPLIPIVLICSLLGRKDSFPVMEVYGMFSTFLLFLALPLLMTLFLFDPYLSGQTSPVFPLFLFLIIWVNDSMAYVSGILTGHRLLAASISPRKTVEGLIGGLLFSLLTAYLWSRYFPDLDILAWLSLATVIVVAGTLGDLSESWIKRQAKLKDSGTLLPGHGGILDRIDSLLFAAPAAFACLIILKMIYA